MCNIFSFYLVFAGVRTSNRDFFYDNINYYYYLLINIFALYAASVTWLIHRAIGDVFELVFIFLSVKLSLYLFVRIKIVGDSKLRFN